MKKAKIIGSLLITFITMPIWYFILYRIIEATNQSELVWFLYWVYLPVNFFGSLLVKVAEE